MIGKPPETIRVRLEGSILIIFVEDFTHGVGPKAASADLNPHIGRTVADQKSFGHASQIHRRERVFTVAGEEMYLGTSFFPSKEVSNTSRCVSIARKLLGAPFGSATFCS